MEIVLSKYYITRSFLWTTKIRTIMTIGIDLFHDTSVLAIFSHPNTWGDDNHSDKQQRWLAKMSMTCDVHGVVRRHDGPCFWTCGSFSKMMRVWPAPAPSGFVCGVTVAARGAFPGPEWSGFCPLCRKAPKTCCELKSSTAGGRPTTIYGTKQTLFPTRHFLDISTPHTKLSEPKLQKCYFIVPFYTTDSYLLKNILVRTLKMFF